MAEAKVVLELDTTELESIGMRQLYSSSGIDTTLDVGGSDSEVGSSAQKLAWWWLSLLYDSHHDNKCTWEGHILYHNLLPLLTTSTASTPTPRPAWPPLPLPIEVTKADLSQEGNVAVLQSNKVACLSLSKTSLNEGRSLLTKSCDFTRSKVIGKLERTTCI